MSGQPTVWQGFSSLVAGAVFGMGLAVAQMTNPNKVLNFLDLTGQWDASLLGVLGSAVVSSALVFRWILRQPKPWLEAQFHLPKPGVVDARLITGSAIFGVGWGIAGYCPGPAIASLAFANPEALWVLPALLAGTAAQRLMDAASLNTVPSRTNPLDKSVI
jgi:uncharacterized membrane protein YedE/YeeE